MVKNKTWKQKGKDRRGNRREKGNEQDTEKDKGTRNRKGQ